MFLPITKQDMKTRGIEQLDFIIVTGDAYIDQPSFGTAIIGRVLEREGYKVGVIAQPRWEDCEDFKQLGRPRLGFLINSGSIDSMVNHYSVNKRKRRKDAYTPGGVAGKRPDRAVIVYAQRAREVYKDVPILLGGIEASLRRTAHYDYWSNKVRRSILLDAKADLLMYGMSEKSIVEIAEALDSGMDISHITYVNGTVYKAKNLESVYDYIELPDYDTVTNSKEVYAKSFLLQSENTDPYNAKVLVERYDNNTYIVQNPPALPLTQLELDHIYELPFENAPHPSYKDQGYIPAIEEVKFSITSNRGCFGSCSFCALTFHQGRIVQGRSEHSIVEEAKRMTKMEGFKGYIHDIGGPTANFSQPQCKKAVTAGVCKHKKCLYPRPCNNLEVDHKAYMSVLKKVRELPDVKKVFIRSGIRYDYLLEDKQSKQVIKEIAKHHVSGQLRVAPEHISDNALRYMGKPSKEVYQKFTSLFEQATKQVGKEQYVVPYLMSSHPGTTLDDAIELACYLKEINYIPEQVQDFYPTPSTLATCMYYTGIDPRTMEKVYVAKTSEEKAMQRALLQYNKKENYKTVLKALRKAGREDLIGNHKKCLISAPNRQAIGRPKTTSNKKRKK